MPGAIIVELVSTCQYCRRRAASGLCGNCQRVLCERCRKGLGCLDKLCSSRPDGSGVR
jgi:hypothetical protein